MSYGLDWGRGETNIDKETGIRFGVIRHNEVFHVWAEDSESLYEMCEDELEENEEWEENEELEYVSGPTAYVYNKNGYKCYQSCDDFDIFVEKSSYFTYARFCSPCAPGAVSLMEWIEVDSSYKGGAHDKCGVPLENQRGYCFGHEWFENGKAPYPVYSVETGKLVNSEVI